MRMKKDRLKALENKNSPFYNINQVELSVNELRQFVKMYKILNPDKMKEFEKLFNKTKKHIHDTRFQILEHSNNIINEVSSMNHLLKDVKKK